jgi:hypothetical protein
MLDGPKEQIIKNQELKKIVEQNAFKEKMPLGPKPVNKYLSKFINK